MTTTLELLQRLLSEGFGLPLEQLQPEMRLEDIGVDSLTFLEVTFALEKELNIRFPENPGPIHTLGDVVAIVDKLRGATGA